MRALSTRLSGVIVLENTVRNDDRGFFAEIYRESEVGRHGVPDRFVQDNHSRSRKGVLRGLHFQAPDPQAKLVTCIRGAIWDVVVDIRPDSPTFGEWEAWVLDDALGRVLYCPDGFAHGFVALSDTADVVYKCSSYYRADAARFIRFDDPEIGIRWPGGPFILSHQDANAPSLRDALEQMS